jgi:uncharacterized protein (TIGR03118 family)
MGSQAWARRRTGRIGIWFAALGIVALAAMAVAPMALAKPSAGRYKQHNLVSDQAGQADLRDPDLVNAWGLAFGPSTPAWVADNGTDVSTLYSGATSGYRAKRRATPVSKFPLTVSIPGGAPTGLVFNGTDSFEVGAGPASAPANFIFSSESGRITAWSQSVPPMNMARTVDTVPGAIYKGLAIAKAGGEPRLYATDFHNGRVDVWDGSFSMVHEKGAFRDRKIPDRFAPFGIQAVKGKIVVTYAKQDAKAEDDVPSAGNGFVDIFNTRGKLLDRFASRGHLNSPWGVVKAPKGFGKVGGKLLIGNFGDGRINAYSLKSGKFRGTLENKSGHKLTIDGLWALKFGNGVIGTSSTLLFTAGPDEEAHGLFGTLKPKR